MTEHAAVTDERRELAAAVRAFLTDRVPAATLRSTAGPPEPWPDRWWRQLAGELGLTGLAVPAEHGGGGGTTADLAVALEETGRVLLPAPYLSTVVAAGLIGAAVADGTAGAGAADVLPGLAGGTRIGAVAPGPASSGWDHGPPTLTADRAGRLDGTLAHVPDGATADLLVVAADRGGVPVLLLVDAVASGICRERLLTVDQTRPQARWTFDRTPATQLATGTEAVSRAQDLLAVALAVESVGSARACLESTVAHLRTRVQFGRPLGSFQALRHRVADLTVAVEAAAAIADHAVRAAVGAPGDLPVAAPLAKAVCGEAFSRCAAENIQLHGGIAITWEHDAHLYFKRATATRLLGGSPRGLRRLAWARAHPG